MNNPNNETIKFIEYVKEVMLDLYDKYNEIEDPGMMYRCPLDDLINNGYDFAMMDNLEAVSAD